MLSKYFQDERNLFFKIIFSKNVRYTCEHHLSSTSRKPLYSPPTSSHPTTYSPFLIISN